MALLERDVFLVIRDAEGSGLTSSASGGGGGHGTVPFLHVAPLFYPQPELRRVRDDVNDRDDDDGGGSGGGGASTTATSWAVSAHAWLSASLTDVFASPSHPRDNGGGGDYDGGDRSAVVLNDCLPRHRQAVAVVVAVAVAVAV